MSKNKNKGGVIVVVDCVQYEKYTFLCNDYARVEFYKKGCDLPFKIVKLFFADYGYNLDNIIGAVRCL